MRNPASLSLQRNIDSTRSVCLGRAALGSAGVSPGPKRPKGATLACGHDCGRDVRTPQGGFAAPQNVPTSRSRVNAAALQNSSLSVTHYGFPLKFLAVQTNGSADLPESTGAMPQTLCQKYGRGSNGRETGPRTVNPNKGDNNEKTGE